MVIKELKNKVVGTTTTKEKTEIKRIYSFPKEGLSIEATSMEEAIEKKNVLLDNKINND